MTYQTSGVQDQSFTLDVPAGKTLKIESAGINGNSANLSKRMFLLLNGVIIAGGLVPEDSFNSTDNEFAYYPIHFPIWLPAGAFTIKIPSNSNSSPMTAFISGIEFNIVP